MAHVKCDNIKEGNYYISVYFTNKKDFCVSNEIEPYDKKINYRVGLYATITDEDSKFEQLSLKERNAKKNYITKLIKQETDNSEENKMYFALDGEPDSWRVIKLDNDKRGYGYIRYKNNSDAFLKEKLKFLKFKNITIIPFLEEGYFFINYTSIRV